MWASRTRGDLCRRYGDHGLPAGGGNLPTFLQRAYDCIIHVALQDLPVIFCMDRAGLSMTARPITACLISPAVRAKYRSHGTAQ